MPIVAPTPTDVPAQPAVVYDQYWMKSFQVMANNPTNKIRVTAILHKARDTGNGVYELSPVDPDVIVNVPDLTALIAQNPNVGTLQASVLQEVAAIAIANHQI